MGSKIATISPVLNKDPGKLTPKQINKYIDGIYDGSIDERNLPVEVYDAIAEYLKSGLYQGFGQTLEEAEGADLELLSQLRENIYMFSAAKTYQMTKEISSLLIGDDGEPRTAAEFNQVARENYDNWNDNYGATEYQTAMASASSAAKWQDAEDQKDVLPNLRYSAIMDENTSDICAPLNGLVAPIDDPIWATCTPPNHFNCRCTLLQEGPDANLTPDGDKDKRFEKVNAEMDDMFKQNPGQTGEVFDKDHPYFSVPDEDRDYAKQNFNLPIPEKD